MLVVRVHEELLAAERIPAVAGDHGIWAPRYREINDRERYMVDNGIHVVKVMLNVSKRKQAKRFLKRIDHPEKNWKFSPSDVRTTRPLIPRMPNRWRRSGRSSRPKSAWAADHPRDVARAGRGEYRQ